MPRGSHAKQNSDSCDFCVLTHLFPRPRRKSANRTVHADCSAMKATLYLLLLLSSSAHAKKGGRPSKPGKPAGFAPRAAVAKQPKASSLETKLLQEHKTNCAVAKQSFAVCADDGPGTYTAGWERFSGPADAVTPGNECCALNTARCFSDGARSYTSAKYTASATVARLVTVRMARRRRG